MSTATSMLQFYLDAEAKVLKGLSVRMGDRQLTRANLAEIQAGRREWESKVARESGAGGGFKAADFRGCE
jgi:hypothetical protein